MWPLIWVTVVFLKPGDVSCSGQFSGESVLVRELFRDYIPAARPVSEPTEAVQVSMSFSLDKLNKLSTRDQYISVNGWITASWVDPRFIWDTEAYGVEELTVPPHYVWLPELTLANTAGDFFDESHYRHFKVQIYGEDGTVYWYPGGEFKAACTIDVTYYPFDTQVCTLKFANWVFSTEQVNLTVDKDFTDPLETYRPDGEWEILNTTMYRAEEHECCPSTYIVEISFSILLRRRPGFYTINIICPTIILSVLVLLLFWLPPESGEKISMGLTLVLSFVIFILLVSENVPNSSLAVPLIEIYLFLQFGLTGLSVCVSIIALNLHHRADSSADLCQSLQCAQTCLPSGHGLKQEPEVHHNVPESFVNMNGPALDPVDHLKSVLSQLHFTIYKITRDKERLEENKWHRLARLLDRVAFVIFLIIFAAVSIYLLAVLPARVPYTFDEHKYYLGDST